MCWLVYSGLIKLILVLVSGQVVVSLSGLFSTATRDGGFGFRFNFGLATLTGYNFMIFRVFKHICLYIL